MPTQHTLLKPGVGKILISKPVSLLDKDKLYKRSVILLTDHRKEGFAGFLLNKPSDCNLTELEGFSVFDSPIYYGGPNFLNILYCIHALECVEDSIEIAPGIYYGGDAEDLKEKMKIRIIKENDIHFFYGMTAWDAGELEEEIKKGMWFVLRPPKEIVFFGHKRPWELWSNAVYATGNHHAMIVADFSESSSLS